jgi:hypothetical protein
MYALSYNEIRPELEGKEFNRNSFFNTYDNSLSKSNAPEYPSVVYLSANIYQNQTTTVGGETFQKKNSKKFLFLVTMATPFIRIKIQCTSECTFVLCTCLIYYIDIRPRLQWV